MFSFSLTIRYPNGFANQLSSLALSEDQKELPARRDSDLFAPGISIQLQFLSAACRKRKPHPHTQAKKHKHTQKCSHLSSTEAHPTNQSHTFARAAAKRRSANAANKNYQNDEAFSFLFIRQLTTVCERGKQT